MVGVACDGSTDVNRKYRIRRRRARRQVCRPLRRRCDQPSATRCVGWTDAARFARVIDDTQKGNGAAMVMTRVLARRAALLLSAAAFLTATVATRAVGPQAST